MRFVHELQFILFGLFMQEVLNYYEILRSEFLAASVYASTFEDFFEYIEPIKSQLPVVTQEIGDTWIQGISSDPYKVSAQRAFQTGLELCYNSSKFYQIGLDSIKFVSFQFFSS